MPSCCCSNRYSYPHNPWHRLRPSTIWRCASTKSCSVSHRSQARCGSLRRYLKLRIKKRRCPREVAANGCRLRCKLLRINSLAFAAPMPTAAVFLAAHVHLCSTDKSLEPPAVLKKVLIVDDSPAQVKI